MKSIRNSKVYHVYSAIFSPKDKPLWHQILQILLTLAVLLAAAQHLGMLSLQFAKGNYSDLMWQHYMDQPRLIVLNVAPFLMLALLLWALSGRAWLAFLLDGAICLIYSWANYWKLMARSDPVYGADLFNIKEAAQMSGQYITFTPEIIKSFCFVVLVTVVLFFFFRGRLPRISLRLGLSALLILCSVVSVKQIYLNSDLYDSFTTCPYHNPYKENTRFVSRGGLYPFIYSLQSIFPQPPEDYSEEAAEAILAEYEEDSIPEDQQVSVICVMLEAFSDLSQYTDCITGGDPYEAFHQLQAESYSGQLVTNIFAGGTIVTERNVLTGFSTVTNFQIPSWSYARYFADNGYALNGSHCGYMSFYSRNVVNQNLGFDNYYFFENHYEQFSEEIATDDIFLPEVARLCQEDMAKGTPVFSYNVTYQNHGPYSTDQLDRFERYEYVPQGVLSTEGYFIVNNYLNGVADTSRQMLAMADTFRESEEPVILVFFGDHKPWLGDQGSIYPELGIDLESELDQSFYNRYNTEYLIWANDSAKAALGSSFQGTGPTISPCFLMNVLFDLCDWEGPAYKKLTDQVMAQLPVITTNGRYMETDTLIDEESLSDTAAKLLSDMDIARFYLTRDYMKNASH